jgi:enterochelin esterase-like enzyme
MAATESTAPPAEQRDGRVINLWNITVVSMPFLVGLAVVTLAAWLTPMCVRSIRRRRGLAWSLAGLACVLTLTCVADGFNSYYSYLPNVSDVVDAVAERPPPHLTAVVTAATKVKAAPAPGRLVTLTIPAGDGMPTSQAWVWLPPQYFQPDQPRLPVLYLFHGSPGMPKDWFHAGRAAEVGLDLARSNRPVIEVAPRMSRDWLDDPECVNGRTEQVENHLLHAIIPTVDRSLRTIASRNGRIFAGMSAGGYCALNLGLRHRDLVATILDLSGFTVPTHSGGMRALFGPHGLAQVAPNSPATYAGTLRSGPPMRIWLDSGSDDKTVVREMTAIAPTLRADHLTVVQKTRRGGHTYSVWRPALKQAALWAVQPPAR